MPEATKHSMWVGIGEKVISFVVGVVIASFFLGGARQKVSDVVQWKDKTEPRIERMDRQGTVSFEYFLSTYKEEQGKQYRRLEALEKEVNHMDNVELRIDRLEKKIGEDP